MVSGYRTLHKSALKLGADFCKVIPAVHALTGYNYSSKADTKEDALKDNTVSEGFRVLDPDV